MHFLQIGLFGELALQGLCNIVRALVKIHIYLVVHFWYFAGLVDSKRGSCGWAESQAEPLSSGLTLSEPTYATLVGTRFLPQMHQCRTLPVGCVSYLSISERSYCKGCTFWWRVPGQL